MKAHRLILISVLTLLAAATAFAHHTDDSPIVGTVKSLQANRLVVTTSENAEVTFTLTEKTKYSKAELAPGVRVSVSVDHDGKTATAVKIVADVVADKVVRVEPKNVCMINDRSMAMEQIPVAVEGRTYYGCCPMCKERLLKDASSRFAIDPVTGRKVDKAKAVIGALPGAAVLYFESAETLAKYNAGARAAD
jgi:YHS domain-containing protein